MWTRTWTKVKESFFTALTAVLIILTVFILVWIPIKFIPKLFSGFQNEVATSLSSMLIPAEDIKISLNKKSISSGEAFRIQITETTGQEEYLLSYTCIDGVVLKLDDSTKTEILCGQEFYLLRDDGIIDLIGFSTDKRYTTVPITISRQADVNSKLEIIGTLRIAISNISTTPVINTPDPVVDNTPVYNPTNVVYNGRPDFLVRTLEKGVIDRNTGLFRKTDYINSTDRAAIRFEVRNIGEGRSGAWNFTATLPSATMSYYTSDSQVNLNPNDRIEFTLGFDNPNTTGLNTLTINVDPSNYINEIVESNNTLTEYFTVNNYYNNNYNNDWYNYNNNNYTTLTGSCSASPFSVQSGSSMTWYAQASGGTGSYTYYWTGTDSLSGYGQNVSKVYYSTGTKSAYVTITSGSQSITRDCTAYVNSSSYNTGKADFSIRLIGVGTLNTYGQFINTTQVARGSNVAIKVEITNNGGQATGLWDITSTMLPSMSGYTYRSENIISLNAGDKTEMTITFNNPTTTGDNTITVNVDPNYRVDESNEGNNTLSSIVRVY